MVRLLLVVFTLMLEVVFRVPLEVTQQMPHVDRVREE